MYIRSILEHSCQVWHFSITEDENSDLERVQKTACKIILKENYTCYEDARKILKLETLHERRDTLCLKFAKKCVKHEKAKDIFPLNTNMKTHHGNQFKVQHAKRARLLNSTVPQLQRALNVECRRKTTK